MRARNGDHLLVPFECDICIFRKLRGASPDMTSKKDDLLLGCIRRVTLDAFWSRASSTVQSNKYKIKIGLDLSSSVGLEGPYVNIGSMPTKDEFGYEVAIQIVLASMRPGRYSSQYSQWDTIRKYRTIASNYVKSSPQGNEKVLTLGDDKGQVQRSTSDPCASYWFSRFSIGCKNRMGQDWRPNKAFSTELLLGYFEKIEDRLREDVSSEGKNQWLALGAYSVVTYIISLRGSEGFLVDLRGLRKYSFENQEEKNYFLIPLLGKVKGEAQDRCHLLPCAFKTKSGLSPHEWIKSLILLKEEQGFIDGPLFTTTKGLLISSSAMDGAMHDVLEELFDSSRFLFPASIQMKADIRLSYLVFRSFRRSSDTRALNEGVSSSDIDTVNRWHKVEKSGGNRPSFDMRQHYAQFDLLIGPFLRYTSAM